MYITAQMITADNEAEKEDNNYAKLAFFCMLRATVKVLCYLLE